MICEICGKEVSSFASLGKHIVVHGVSVQDYYDKYLGGKGKCKECGSEVRFKSLSKGYVQFCSTECAYKNRIGKPKIVKEKVVGTVKCEICEDMVVSIKALSQHIIRHNISSQDYYDKYILENCNEKFCEECGGESKFNGLAKGYQKFCSLKCSNGNEQRKLLFRESYLKNDLNSINKKRQQTNLERYGNIIANRNEEIKQKNKLSFLKGRLKTKLKYLDELNLNVVTKNLEEKTHRDEITFECKDCGKTFVDNLANILQRIYPCSCKRPISKSVNENELKKFLSTYFDEGELLFNTRLEGYELDIYIPKLNIAIEYNGLYWHSEKVQSDPKNYHYNKYILCKNHNIRLIQIFEDEWISKNEIVKNRLLHILKVNTPNKIFARNCTIKEIDHTTKNEFLDKYHIQGKDSSKIKLGAFYNNDLVAIMTFSVGNISKGSHSKAGVWELNRFCQKFNQNCIGIAGKMLTYFKKNYDWDTIFSYADLRWSQGNLYNILGFNLEQNININYWYTKDGMERIHRFALRKKEDEPKDIPEWILRQKEGYYRIWDCGNLKFTMTNGG